MSTGKGQKAGKAGRIKVPADIKIRATPVVLTLDAAFSLVGGASFVALARRCPCREERKCADFPVSLGCLYLGEGARGIVAQGIADEVDRPSALAHVRRADELGLVHIILWTSAELRSLGTGIDRALELCSCCPCCCIPYRTDHASRIVVDGIAGTGVSSVSRGSCSLCGRCEDACPFKALTVGEDGPIVDEERCKGCGRCARVCEEAMFGITPRERIPVALSTGGTGSLDRGDYLKNILAVIGGK